VRISGKKSFKEFYFPKEDEHTVEYRIRFLFEKQRVGLLGIFTLLMGLLFAYREGDSLSLALWLFSALAIAAGQAWWVHQFFAKPSKHSPLFWARILSLFSVGVGLSLSSGVWLFLDTSVIWQVFLVTAVLVIPAFGSIVFAASYLPIHFAWTASSIIPFAIHLIHSSLPEMMFLGYLLLIMVVPIVTWLGLVVAKEFSISLHRRFENMQLIEELTRQKQIAEKASVDKSRFLAATSHDLRQPLYALDLFLDNLKEQLDSQKSMALLKKAKDSSRALRDLLNALLDVSRLDAGKVVPDCHITRIEDVVQECYDEFLPLAEQKGLRFNLHLAKGLSARTDPVLLARMIRNLLVNAIRYTEKGGIILAVRQREKMLRIEIWDTGKGISEADQAYIFDEFYQIDNPERDREKGLGLGLAIVHRLSGLLEHPVSLKSVKGRGTCFMILLPVCEVSNKSFEKVAVLPSDESLAGRFVLVVDDHQLILDGLRNLLRNWNCEVLAVGSCRVALAELKEHHYPAPDALLVDYRLKNQETSVDVVQQVRNHFSAEIPALIISGEAGIEAERDAQKIGCKFIRKPVDSLELKQMLAKLF